MDRTAFFAGWDPLLRTTVLTALAYLFAVSALRLFGKRTLASFNVFDLVVSIALGSVLASTALDSRISLAQGVLAFVLFAALQFAIEWLAVRSRRVRKAAHNRPTLIAFRGRMLEEVMHRERVARGEVLAALRHEGLPSLASARAVVLEADGSISVVPETGEGKASALDDVEGIEDVRPEGGGGRS
jgi:uncharacterized membrane protein YcaP (DUF421 family)